MAGSSGRWRICCNGHHGCKKIIAIAGPNGTSKTTFAREFLPNEAAVLQLINADLIAAGLSPFAPESAALQAGRLMLAQALHFSEKEPQHGLCR